MSYRPDQKVSSSATKPRRKSQFSTTHRLRMSNTNLGNLRYICGSLPEWVFCEHGPLRLQLCVFPSSWDSVETCLDMLSVRLLNVGNAVLTMPSCARQTHEIGLGIVMKVLLEISLPNHLEILHLVIQLRRKSPRFCRYI